MFIVFLRFGADKDRAKTFMDGHTAWIKQGFDDGVFLLAGSLQPAAGGTILAHNTTLPDLTDRVNADPFVAENVVVPEILEVSPSMTAAPLSFLTA